MDEQPLSKLDRIRVEIGHWALVVFFVVLVMLPWSSSWLEGGVLGSVCVLALGIARLAGGGFFESRWLGAPRNTQLQQPPPAIIEKMNDRDV